MRVPRSYIGKMVEVLWRDPCCRTFETKDLDTVPKGRSILGKVRDRGVLTDITEGVLRIEHSFTEMEPRDGSDYFRVWATFVQEELVESLRVYEAAPEPVREETKA